jgi:hypothetical protein
MSPTMALQSPVFLFYLALAASLLLLAGITQIGDAGLKELAALKKLQMLDLTYTKISDAGLKELAGLQQLRSLMLGYTKISDAGLKELAALKQLIVLSLSGTQVTKNGVAELQKALPKCVIVHDASGKDKGRPVDCRHEVRQSAEGDVLDGLG